jgi:hypothetical protein
MNGEERSEAGRAVVEVAEALVRERVKLLARSYPSDLVGEAAREELLELKPHLQGALEALEDIQRRRSLTHKELTQHHAFKMLLAVTG